jgi:putative SOS response-associated peptidase YedK
MDLREILKALFSSSYTLPNYARETLTGKVLANNPLFLLQTGIYENDHDTKHFVIITTEPNAMAREVHDRMPAILPKEAERYWLDPDADPDQLQQLLLPYPTHLMRAYPISTLVNSPRNDSAEIIKPVKI